MKKKRRVFVVISNLDFSQGFAWLAKGLPAHEIQLNYILLNPQKSHFAEFLRNEGIAVDEIQYRGKKDFLRISIKLWFTFLRNKPDVVHAHLFDASLISMLSAFFAFVPHRIYTRHHSTYHHTYFPHAVKYDRMINFFSTHIIAVSDVVKEVLCKKENVKPDKVVTIHHGIESTEFINISDERKESIRKKYALNGSSSVIGVISRYTEWKGITYIINAFSELLKEGYNLKLVLANAKGDYKEIIQNSLSKLPSESYIEIEFEADIAALYTAFDIFVHTPIDKYSEAFGQIYTEAMMSKCACVFTRSGIGNKILVNEKNCLVVDYKSQTEIKNAIIRLLTDDQLKEKIRINAYNDVVDEFKLSDMVEAHKAMYLA